MYNTVEFLKRMKENQNIHPMEKLERLVYFLTQNVNGNNYAHLYRTLYAAQKSIYESIIQQHKLNHTKYNSKDLVSSYSTKNEDRKTIFVDQEEANKKIAMFLKAPDVYTKQLMHDYIAKQDELEKSGAHDKLYCEAERNKAKSVIRLLNEDDNLYDDYVNNSTEALNDGLNLIGYLRKDVTLKNDPEPLKSAINLCKPGFFEKLFRRTSNQYKNFEKAFNDRLGNNISREELENAAKAYLIHKIPSYNGEELPDPRIFERLDDKSRRRAILCYDVLLSTEKSRSYELKQAHVKEAVNNVIKDTNADKELENIKADNFNKLEKVAAKDQIDLQNKLKEEVSEVNNNIIPNNNIIQNKNDINIDLNEDNNLSYDDIKN